MQTGTVFDEIVPRADAVAVCNLDFAVKLAAERAVLSRTSLGWGPTLVGCVVKTCRWNWELVVLYPDSKLIDDVSCCTCDI